jgi:two-component system, OmpR family, phosphate regulon response regulator PhoB
VLVVDDEPDIRKLVAFHLKRAGFEVHAVGTGAEAIDAVASFRPAVLVLDLMLPDIPGPEVCRRLRASPETQGLGILMLSARGDEYDRVLGFEVGTDDYVVKPFSPRELVHRVRALARRATPATVSRPEQRAPFCWRELTLDRQRHEVTIDGEPVSLRPLEYRLLELFFHHPDEVLTRAKLLEGAWGITAEVNTRTVDTHVRRLREALGSHCDAIETVYGFGYRLRQL